MTKQREGIRGWLISLALHGVGILVLGWVLANPGRMMFRSSQEARPVADTTLMYLAEDPAPEPARVRPAPRAPVPAPDEPRAVAPVLPPVSAPAAGPTDSAGAGIAATPDVPAELPPVSLAPRFGDGRLWVRPQTVLGRAGAGGNGTDTTTSPFGGFDATTHIARVDSAIRGRLMAFLDTLPADSFPLRFEAPSWTTEIDGRTWGIDQQWLYLGDLKLPSMLLALIPMPAQGNYEQAQRARALQQIREDLLQAAARARSSDDFRRYVRELRERRDAERNRNRDQDN